STVEATTASTIPPSMTSAGRRKRLSSKRYLTAATRSPCAMPRGLTTCRLPSDPSPSDPRLARRRRWRTRCRDDGPDVLDAVVGARVPAPGGGHGVENPQAVAAGAP